LGNGLKGLGPTFDANALQRGVVDEGPHAEVARHVFVLGDLNNLPVAANHTTQQRTVSWINTLF
jgi:hypothetical protein